MASEERKKRERGILERLGTFGDLKRGMNDAFDVSGEDRRRQLTDFRQAYQNKAEATQASLRLGTIPGLDSLRQAKTVNQNIPADQRNFYNQVLANLPVPAYSPGNWAHRQFTGMNLGRDDLNPEFPRPISSADVVDLGPEAEKLLRQRRAIEVSRELAAYNEDIRRLPAMQKAGHALATVADEIQSNGVRSLWWLINAPQAVVDLASEGLATYVAPDLRGTVELNDLEQAVRDGDLKYVGPSGRRADEDISEVIGNYTQDRALGLNEFSDEQIADMAKSSVYGNPENFVQKRPGVQRVKSQRASRPTWRKRRFSPNAAGLMSMLPASFAINSGMGLMDRPEGYAAVVPTEDDPRETSNMLAEVAARYILGREGKLLPYDEFAKERPDVSNSDYQAYKAYKFDKNLDLNPFDDGKTNLFGGILKTNDDGIKGAELAFLGRSLGWNEALLPTIAALGGTAVGAAIPNIRSYRLKKQAPPGYGEVGNPYQEASWKKNPAKKAMGFMPEPTPRNEQGFRMTNPAFNKEGRLNFLNPIAERIEKAFEYAPVNGRPPSLRKGRVLGAMLAGGLGGMAAGTLIGNQQENSRREAKFKERFPNVDYETYKDKSLDAMDRKIEMVKANPNSQQEREANKTGFNKRAYQSALMAQTLENNTQIQSLVDEEKRRRAMELEEDTLTKLAKVQEIENQLGGNSM